jgi:hypothetical protein
MPSNSLFNSSSAGAGFDFFVAIVISYAKDIGKIVLWLQFINRQTIGTWSSQLFIYGGLRASDITLAKGA